MIHVDFNPEDLDDTEIYEDQSGKQWQAREWWTHWEISSEESKNAAIEDASLGKRHTFKEKVWRDLKHFLLQKVFHGKCAYCESYIAGIYPGEAEHYRPKGKVTIKEGEAQKIIECEGKPHPGYYWLTYHWKNLLPVCKECNSIDGKMNQFPIKNKHVSSHEYGEDPDILDQLEDPLLLHPYSKNGDPHDHIRFGDFGLVVAVDDSEIGSTSITVYNLGRESLIVDRYRSQCDAWRHFLTLIAANINAKNALEDSAGKRLPHSAARFDYIDLKWREIGSILLG